MVGLLFACQVRTCVGITVSLQFAVLEKTVAVWLCTHYTLYLHMHYALSYNSNNKP